MRKIGILPCSGACNVGMMTTKAVVRMCKSREDVDFVCALGLPLGIEGIISNARGFDRTISLNGCEIRCASRSLEAPGIRVDREFIVTRDFGIKKNKDFSSEEEGLDRIAAQLERTVDYLQRV